MNQGLSPQRFSAHLMLRYRWKDPRLAFSATAPAMTKVIGETLLRERIWVPHVYLVNEHESRVMGTGREDVIVTIRPSGTVLFSTRIKVTMLCIMDLQKFPFDKQTCPMVFESCESSSKRIFFIAFIACFGPNLRTVSFFGRDVQHDRDESPLGAGQPRAPRPVAAPHRVQPEQPLGQRERGVVPVHAGHERGRHGLGQVR